MRIPVFAGVALLAFLITPVRGADTAPRNPTLVFRLQSVDELVATAKFVAAQAGQEEVFKQVEGILKAMTGAKGIEGLDPKRAIGAYGQLSSEVADSSAVILLPVVDEKTLLAFAERVLGKADKDKNDLFTITPPGIPVPLYFRFANKYVYISNSDKALAPAALLMPATVLAAEPGRVLSLRMNLAEIPDGVRDMLVGQIALRLGMMKEKRDGESAADHALRTAALDEIATLLTQVIKEGEGVHTAITIAPREKDLSFSLEMKAKKGTTLAQRIADLAKPRSAVASLLSRSSAAQGQLHVTLPPRVQKALARVLDERVEQELKKQPNEDAQALIKAIVPTLKKGVFDLAMDWRGPSAKKHYTVVVGAQTQDGLAIERVLKSIVKKLPAEIQQVIELDAEKSGKSSIHKLNIGQFYDENLRTLLGDAPLYFSFREDAVFYTAGEDGLKAIKDALAAEPVRALPLRVQVALASLVPLIEKAQPKAGEAAKAAFGKTREGDRVELSLEGGESLKLRVTAAAPIIRFLSMLAPQQEKDQ